MTGILFQGDAERELRAIESRSVDCIVTSPPYFRLRDYGIHGQIGMEESVEDYIENILKVARQAYRILKPEGVFFLNLGDTYSGSAPKYGHRDPKNLKRGQLGTRNISSLPAKNLLFIPARVAMALQEEGWIARQDIIWHKTNAMGSNIKDRCITAHEYIFLLSKQGIHYFDYKAIQTDLKVKKQRAPAFWEGKNKAAKYGTRFHSGRLYKPPSRAHARSVWPIGTSGFKGDHPAVFPPKLAERMILAGCPLGGTVADPFFGAGTVGLVCESLGRNWIGVELNPTYATTAVQRIKEAHPSAKIWEA